VDVAVAGVAVTDRPDAEPVGDFFDADEQRHQQADDDVKQFLGFH
jgi:hypothetical protein